LVYFENWQHRAATDDTSSAMFTPKLTPTNACDNGDRLVSFSAPPIAPSS